MSRKTPSSTVAGPAVILKVKRDRRQPWKAGEGSCFWVPGNVPILGDNIVDPRRVNELLEDSREAEPELPAEAEDNLVALLRESPLQRLFAVYDMARSLGRKDVAGLLPGAVARLVQEGSYSAHLFEATGYLRILKAMAGEEITRQNAGNRHERGVALGILAALGIDIA